MGNNRAENFPASWKMPKPSIGDQVYVEHHGELFEGTIVRLDEGYVEVLLVLRDGDVAIEQVDNTMLDYERPIRISMSPAEGSWTYARDIPSVVDRRLH